MTAFLALLLKEEKAIFTSPIAYVVITAFLITMGYTFTLTLFVTHAPTLVHLFFQIYVLFLLTVPIITMRLVAEERRLRTLELLLTAPISTPASAGPPIVAIWNMRVLRLTAFARSLRSTKLGTSACRAGLSNAVADAPAAVSA